MLYIFILDSIVYECCYNGLKAAIVPTPILILTENLLIISVLWSFYVPPKRVLYTHPYIWKESTPIKECFLLEVKLVDLVK